MGDSPCLSNSLQVGGPSEPPSNLIRARVLVRPMTPGSVRVENRMWASGWDFLSR